MKPTHFFRKISAIKFSMYALCLIFILGVGTACKQASSSLSTQLTTTPKMREALMDKDQLDLALEKSMKEHKIPGVSIAFLQDGALHSTKTLGVLQVGKTTPVNEETMFSVGSISKFVNANFLLKLVASGKLALDSPVNDYLSSWKIEDNKYTQNQPVSLRRILSHTAGLTVHGFGDYQPDEKLPSTVEILNGVAPAKNNKVYVNYEVGSRFKYSGGGITITQLIVEDLTGLPYHKAAQEVLIDPLGLTRTSYENPLPASWGNIAKAHDDDGEPVALPRGYQTMPEAAASGLWTTPTELAKVMSMVVDSYRNKDTGFLPYSLVEDMLTAEKPSQFGLGPKLETVNGETVFYHNGANDSYRATFKVFLNRGSGYAIFTNGANGLDMIKDVKPLLDAAVQ